MRFRWPISVVATLLTASAIAQFGIGPGPGLGNQGGVTALNYLGINALDAGYGSPELPWLNSIKGAGANKSYTMWFTAKTGTPDTDEEACLYPSLDANGWPTTLTPSGLAACTGASQVFTYLYTYMYVNIDAATPVPGASTSSPPASGSNTETLDITGAGTFDIGFGGQISNVACGGPSSSNCTTYLTIGGGSPISGTQVVSTLPSGQAATVTFNYTGDGLELILVSEATPGSNYLTFPYLVRSQYLSNYLAGELLSPEFKADMTNTGCAVGNLNCTPSGFSRLRLMGALNTYCQDIQLNFSGTLAQGAEGGTLSSITTGACGSNGSTTWQLPTGTYLTVFESGDIEKATFTYGSSSVTWPTGLSEAIATNAPGAMAVTAVYTWADGTEFTRPLASNAVWDGIQGVPAEVYLAVCNELGIDCWTNIPGVAGYAEASTPGCINGCTSGYIYNLAALAYNGTGANLSGSVIPSLSSGLVGRIYPEYINETWNGGSYENVGHFVEMGAAIYGFYPTSALFTAGQEFYGAQSAGVGDTFSSVYGAAFSSRARPMYCGQFVTSQWGSGGPAEIGLNTPDWTTRAYTHHIEGLCDAPYMAASSLTSTDAAAMFTSSCSLGSASVCPALTTMEDLAYSNTAGGHTYSWTSAGWVQDAINTQSAIQSALVSALPAVASLPWHDYEAGANLNCAIYETNYGSGDPNYENVCNLLANLDRDANFSYIEFDPGHVFSSNPGYYQAMLNLGVTVNQLNLTAPLPIEAYNTSGWGLLELTTQTVSPLSDAPPRYQGAMNFVAQ